MSKQFTPFTAQMREIAAAAQALYGRKPRLLVSFSGGRTSAFMAIMCKQQLSELFELVFTFANTSCEDEDTLRFANEVDTRFNLGLVWLEAEVHPNERKACTHRVVTYETAKRGGEVFEDVVSAYGLPNQTFKFCTRELKLNPMKSYCRSIGWQRGEYMSAVGIRTDETRRVAASAAAQNIAYPLVDWWPTDKQDVLAYFEDFDWDLAIPEHRGNCVTCFKKSDRKLHLLHQEDPRNFDFAIKLQDLYENVGPNNVPGPRKMFRLRRSARELVAQFQALDFDSSKLVTDGGCSESCEVYDMAEDLV